MEAAAQQAARSGGSSVWAAPQHRISKHGRSAMADELEVRTGGGGGAAGQRGRLPEESEPVDRPCPGHGPFLFLRS